MLKLFEVILMRKDKNEHIYVITRTDGGATEFAFREYYILPDVAAIQILRPEHYSTRYPLYYYDEDEKGAIKVC